MRLPLKDLLVVSLEQAVAAPFCTMRLADAGARVIKLERPEGDFARGYDDVALGQSSYFVWLNRGKESVTVDLRNDRDRSFVQNLVGRADIFVQNLKPGSLDKLGLGLDALHKQNPRLISCSISGYGESGPMAHRKAYDLLIQAESGLASINGKGDEVARVGFSVVDIVTGMNAAQGILEAVIARAESGVGAQLRVAMFDAIVELMAVPFLHAAAGKPPKRIGLAHPSIAPYGVFHTSDHQSVLISVQNEREWEILCRKVLQNPALLEDERFGSNVSRVKHRRETDAAVARALAKFDAVEVAKQLEVADIAFAFVNEMAAMPGHPNVRTIAVETANGTVKVPAPPNIWVNDDRDYGPVPKLGDKNDAVKQEFG